MLAALARLGIRLIDYLVRQVVGVREFSEAEGCILRIASERAKEHLVLSDGTVIAPGDLVCGIHLWNERLPPMPPSGPDLVWALEMYRGMTCSLTLLAEHLQADPAVRDAVALHGSAVALQEPAARRLEQIFCRLGFDVHSQCRRTRWGRFALWWQNLYANWLVWTYNAPAVGGKRLGGSIDCQLWLSRRVLEARYGAANVGRPEQSPTV